MRDVSDVTVQLPLFVKVIQDGDSLPQEARPQRRSDLCYSRIDLVNRAVPGLWVLLRDKAPSDAGVIGESHSHSWIALQVDKSAFVIPGVDQQLLRRSEPARPDIVGHHQRKKPIGFDIDGARSYDKCPVCSGCDSDGDTSIAACLFKCREASIQVLQEPDPVCPTRGPQIRTPEPIVQSSNGEPRAAPFDGSRGYDRHRLIYRVGSKISGCVH